MVYEIDGARFSSLPEFFDEMSTVLTAGVNWGRNLDAFNDILRGGFGTPDGGFTIRWRNHALSRERLGYAETVQWLREQLRSCHPDNRIRVAQELAEAQANRGSTVFEWLVEIIRDHGPGGRQSEDGVDLILD
jgi:RNAse (barnase) inhibitor barstar